MPGEVIEALHNLAKSCRFSRLDSRSIHLSRNYELRISSLHSGAPLSSPGCRKTLRSLKCSLGVWAVVSLPPCPVAARFLRVFLSCVFSLFSSPLCSVLNSQASWGHWFQEEPHEKQIKPHHHPAGRLPFLPAAGAAVHLTCFPVRLPFCPSCRPAALSVCSACGSFYLSWNRLRCLENFSALKTQLTWNCPSELDRCLPGAFTSVSLRSSRHLYTDSGPSTYRVMMLCWCICLPWKTGRAASHLCHRVQRTEGIQ